MDLVRPNDEIRVGGEIESQCKKCGRATTHRIISMKETGTPYKCECLACNGKHVYKKPVEVEPPSGAAAARPQTVSRKKAAPGEAPSPAKAPVTDALGTYVTEITDFRAGAARGGTASTDVTPFAGPAPSVTPAARPPAARPSRPARKDQKTSPENVTVEELEDISNVLADEADDMAEDLSADEDDEFVASLSVDADFPDVGSELEDEPGFEAAEDDDPYGVERALDSAAGKARSASKAGKASKPAKAREDSAKSGQSEARKPAAKPRAAKDRGKGLEDAEAILRKEWEEMRASPPSKIIAYTLAGSYAANQHIEHPAFGLGIVKAVIPPNKIRVNFEKGMKTLIMKVQFPEGTAAP
ncbi:MAG: hypothetical protein LBQ79_11140 [Deltaproteobacteria bacterium]|jgi:hypothetical protein|nr:hypothetical protein [Deltaproteobacteria bacterium]